MAQATQNHIIDLTSEDNSDETIARARAACENAFAAASRLSNHVESLKTSKPIMRQSPKENVDSTKKDSPSAAGHKKRTLSPLGTIPKPFISEQDGLKNDERNDAIPRSNSSIPSSRVSAARSALGTAASRPAGSPPVVERTGVKKQQPKETKPVTPRTNAFPSRTPRSAAISAKQNIAESYDRMEKWANKDPYLIPQQAGVSTPRRLGRTNDDLAEWSPNANIKGTEEEGETSDRVITDSPPTPSAGKPENLAANGDSSMSQTQRVSNPQGARKRKFSDLSQYRGSPVKVARWNEEPSAGHESSPPDSANPAFKKHVHDVTGNKSPVGVLPRCISPAKSTIPQRHERIDPRLQRAIPGASEPTTSKPGLYSASLVHIKYTALFETVVYPAIKKSKKRHYQSVPQDDLEAIGKSIVDEVIERLATNPEDPNQLNEDTRKKIKRFVKKSFRRRLRKFNAQSSHKSATPANDFSNFALANHAGDNSILAGDHRPATTSLDPSKNAFSKRADAITENEDAQAPRQPRPKHLDQQPLSSPLSSFQHSADESSHHLPNESLQHFAHESSASSFAPGYDRGRYPALRRRRGNKNYTPARTSKIASNLVDDYSVLSTNRSLTAPALKQRTYESGISDGKDQVRLLKALANQPMTLAARATQLTASTPEIENKRTPINEKSALERLTSMEKPTDMGHVAKALREVSAPGTRVAQQVPRKRLLVVMSPKKERRPLLRSQPATALDPNLEHLVAVLVTDTSRGTSQDGQKYTITPADQIQLIAHQNIVKHVGPSSKDGKPKLVRIETKVIDPVRQPGCCISSLLRNRELGRTSRGRQVGAIGELLQLKSETIEPWKHWKGASGDVVAVAWHPDSNVYAFGAAAHTNIEDIQYNRPCNLLLGKLTSNQIIELPDHRIDRRKPETIPNGPNANPAVYEACDPKVYETVTSIAFSPTGDRMFTASHDCTVKIWDVSGGKYECLSTLRHDAWVTSIEVSEHRPGLFATASKSVKDAVRIYRDSSCFENFSASRAEMRPDWKIYPECLRWGPNSYTSHLLLAGFQQWEQEGDLLSGGGQLCLWDAYTSESIKVTPSSQSVYAAAWHPTHPFFATGGAPGNNIIDKINTKTVVRTWDFRTPKRYQVEYECPATDMQDITFSPSNPNIVTAGCTDGSSYVWDWRWPDQVLHRLKHGRPLAELDHTREREDADTGVMLSLWGPGGSLFYTGSSDGMIKAWDVRRHPNDVLIRNVANLDISIQSGAFSPDGQNLLVGDAEGGIHILSSAPCCPRSNLKSTDAHIDLVRASDGSGAKLDPSDDNPGTEGIEAARSLIESGQLMYHKELGVGQGLNYGGPYATYARKESEKFLDGRLRTKSRLRKKFEERQPISKKGEKRWDISIPMTSLLYERKQTLDREKDGNHLARDGLKEGQPKVVQRSTGGETLQTTSRVGGANSPANNVIGGTVASGKEDQGVEYNTIAEEEMIEENFWWSRMGEEEIELARAGRVRS